MRLLSTSLLVLLFLITGCTTANVGADARENQTQRLASGSAPEEAYGAALRIASEYGWKVASSDSSARVFTAEAPGNMGRWDDTIGVSISENDDGSTITVRSTLGQGPNREHVAGYLSEVAAALGVAYQLPESN